MKFEAAYRELELRFGQKVKEDNNQHGVKSIFLPNVTPLALVDFVLIGYEPSRGFWGRTDETADENIKRGFRNFLGCRECDPLHHCVDNYLCRGSSSYYLTDLAKGAVFGSVAWSDAWPKYERWYRLLREELQLVAKPDAVIISIGNKAASFLAQRGLHGHVGKIPHYSGRSRQRGNMAKACPDEWKRFCEKPLELPSGTQVSEAKKKWMFDYKVLFECFRPGGDADWRPPSDLASQHAAGSSHPPCTHLKPI